MTSGEIIARTSALARRVCPRVWRVMTRLEMIAWEDTHRRDAESAEEAQRKQIGSSLRDLCVLCVSAVKDTFALIQV
jgi:hypothetical protein